MVRMADPLSLIGELFKQSQFSKRNHPVLVRKLKEYYTTMDKDVFAEAFIGCLSVALGGDASCPGVKLVLSFAVTFALSLQSFQTEVNEEDMCPFLEKLFNFLLSKHDTSDSSLRYRICFFLNLLLTSMGHDAFIEDDLCDRITSAMLDRMLDRSSQVRAQAVLTLRRLQDPTDEDCPVIKAYIFHMNRDPQAQVRRAVLSVVGKNKKTLAAVLQRTKDVSDHVRTAAFRFLKHITVRSMTIEQREKLLRDGLHDRSEKVCKCVEQQLLPTWLDQYNGEFIKLLRALDAEKALDTSVLMLRVLFKTTTIRSIVEQVPIDPNTKLVPFDKLSGESVIYWRCAVEHLQREGCLDEVEPLLPDLIKFCDYIGAFIEVMKGGTREPWEQATLNFVLYQLFEISKTYDLTDEVGRQHLRDLMLDTLKSDHDAEGLVQNIVEHLVKVVPDTGDRMDHLSMVISELRIPPSTTQCVQVSEADKHERDMKKAKLTVILLQAEEEQYQMIKDRNFVRAGQLDEQIRALNQEMSQLNTVPTAEEVQVEEEPVMKTDGPTLSKCLEIMLTMMQDVKTQLPLFKSLFADMVLPSFDHPVEHVVELAVKTTTVYCLKDVESAKKYMPVFLLQFAVENDTIWLATLKGIFDLLLLFGLEAFGMVPEAETNRADTRSDANTTSRRRVRLFSRSVSEEIPSTTSVAQEPNTSNTNFINILTGLLDNVDQDLRTIAAEGLCKLLLHQRITSAALLSKLIILWNNPVTNDDVYMRQCLTNFFNHYHKVSDSQEMLEQSFLRTLKILANAPDDSPLQDIDHVKVAHLILYLTRPATGASPLAYSVHDNLAVSILAEALNADSDIDPRVLIRSLKFLKLDLDNESTIKFLREAVEKLLSKVKSSEKRVINSLLAFKKTLSAQTATEQNGVREDESDAEAEADVEAEIEDDDDEDDDMIDE